MKIERWMNQPVLTTEADIPVVLAYRKMRENEIRRLPVLDDDGRLVGILSERDALTVLMPHEIDAAPVPPEAMNPTLVRDAMTRTVFVVSPEADVVEAVRIMHDRKVSGLPVVTNGRCVGMITVQDLLEVLLAALDRRLNEINEEILEGTMGFSPAAPKTSPRKRRKVSTGAG
ncbi:MAG: CBS domain-containing protein [bacterium]